MVQRRTPAWHRIVSHRIASPLAAVGSGADAGMLVGQCRHGEGAGWNGTGRERREQKEDQEEKLLKIACRIRGTVSETPCCSQALRSQVLELLLFFP